MTTAPRYIARPVEGFGALWNVWEHVDGSPIRLFVASTSSEQKAEQIAAALNMAQRIEAMAAALMTRPTMPTMDAGGEHAAAPEPAIGEAVRPAVEPQQ